MALGLESQNSEEAFYFEDEVCAVGVAFGLFVRRDHGHSGGKC